MALQDPSPPTSQVLYTGVETLPPEGHRQTRKCTEKSTENDQWLLQHNIRGYAKTNKINNTGKIGQT